ncbi:hypothetical protein MHYP_G00062800, partial [Metynnis hypsauchen]
VRHRGGTVTEGLGTCCPAASCSLWSPFWRTAGTTSSVAVQTSGSDAASCSIPTCSAWNSS